MSIVLTILGCLLYVRVAQADSEAGQFAVNPFTVGQLTVWCILTFIFSVQSVHCVLRISQASRGHRAPYVVLFPSVFLSAVFCVLEILIVIFTNSLPPNESPKGPEFTALYALEGLLDWLCVGPIFWSIVWFIKDRNTALLALQKRPEEEPSIFRTAHHAILISLVVVLTVTGIIISIISSNAVDIDSVQSAQYNMAFYIAFVFWYIATTLDIGVSTYNVNKAMKDAKVVDTFTKVLYYAVLPIYAINAIVSIFFEIVYFPGLLPADMSETAQNILALLEDILMNCLFIAIAYAVLIPRVCVDLPVQLDSEAERTLPSTPSASSKKRPEPLVISPTQPITRLHDSPTRIHHSETDEANEEDIFWGHSTGTEHGRDQSMLIEMRHRKPPVRAMTLSEKSLSDIATRLDHHDKRRHKTEKVKSIETRMTADSQVFSAMSVVAVFVASLTAQLLSLAQTTFQGPSSSSPSSSSSALPNASDNVNSCWYLATFLSLIAGCAASIGAAMRNRMARDIAAMHGGSYDEAVIKRKFEGPADRALTMIFVFVCIMMGISVITLVTGLLIFVWSAQTAYVSVAMTVPALVFVIGAGIAVTIWICK